MNTTAPERATYTVPEAARIIGISPRMLYERIANNDFPAITMGRRRLIPRRIVDELLAGPQLEAVS